MWPEVKIVHGKPRHSQSQGSVERANRDIEEMLGAWMDENQTTDWPSGMKFIQFKKNRALHSGIGRSPYEAMFGCPARVGLASAGILHDEINHLSTEEDVETLIEEMGRESNDLEDPNPQRERGDEEGIVPQIIQFEYENGTNDTGSATESTYEDRIVCNQCSTVLPLGEEASNDGKCIHCERQENIVNERKRSRECLEKQATKMLKLSNRKFSDVQAGTTVRVPIPDVDRARGSPRNVLAVVNSVEDGLYKLGTPHGVLKHKFTRSEFNPCIEKFILLENLSDSAKKRGFLYLQEDATILTI
ncbi:SCAN domain-containing protein 3-like [Photinus pyralis]|uniref:SCAN domain-containing protein 3-like n=1 Tax=Photinus pyralis TaxID=7054 RepID=UPI0012674AC6|nr:SCAN domain-containing protein 3-like [Photinus pyralis]